MLLNCFPAFRAVNSLQRSPTFLGPHGRFLPPEVPLVVVVTRQPVEAVVEHPQGAPGWQFNWIKTARKTA